MYLAVVAAHVVLCVFLVLIIILQPGKGGDVGSAFGGGSSSTMFGPRGPTSILQRGTTAVAVLFMCTSLGLAWYSQNRIGMDNVDRDSEVERLRQEQMERASTEKGIDIEVPEQPEMPPVVED